MIESQPVSKTPEAELVARLREPSTPDGYASILKNWDAIRRLIAEGNKGSLPRDMFETELSSLLEDMAEAADTIQRLDHECVLSMTEIATLRGELDAAEARAELAERERDEAIDRVEDLERDAEIVSVEFEKECWKALRSLISRTDPKFDFNNNGDGTTAEDACDFLAEAMEGCEAQVKLAEDRLKVAREALKPFANFVRSSLWPDDGSEGDETYQLTFNPPGTLGDIKGSDFRCARQALLSTGEA